MSPPSALALKRLGSVECDILLTPIPGASNMPDRLAGKAPLDDSRPAPLMPRSARRISTLGWQRSGR
jgi:metallo-beta-lactamase class B